MAVSVVMPALEMAQETGKLLAWRKNEGDRVTKGDALLEIETDKAVVEVEALEDGILAGITAQVGDEIPVGQTIAWIVAPGESVPAQAAPAAPAARATSATLNASASPTKTTSSPGASSSTARLSPKARRLAKELGVNVNLIPGSGPEGTITGEDVQAFMQEKNSANNSGTEVLSQTARLMAERTTQSWTSVPHFFIVREVDATHLVQARQRLASMITLSDNNKLTITDLLIAQVARTLAKHPRMNASWTPEGIRFNSEINISVAMANKDGVVGAVIHKANTLEIGEISALRHELTQKARAARLRPADITGGSFTISNLGMYKVDAFTAIITPPQSAVLAVGAIVDRVVPRSGLPAIRPMLTLTLSTDHRVADGARAAEFMHDLADAIAASDGSV